MNFGMFKMHLIFKLEKFNKFSKDFFENVKTIRILESCFIETRFPQQSSTNMLPKNETKTETTIFCDSQIVSFKRFLLITSKYFISCNDVSISICK